MPLPDLDAWAVFAAVAEARSFSGAAAAIGVSKGTVSKAVSRLEARIGQALFHRTSRRLALTEAGRPLVEHARRLLADAEAAEEAARDGAALPAGRIRVAAPMSFGVAHLGPLVAAFLADHPAIEVELHLSDARVDIVADGFDLALRISADLSDSSLRARRLCAIPSHLVAAPAYLARAGEPRHPEELSRHRLLGYLNAPGAWRLTGPDGEEASVRATGPLSTDSGEALVPALVAGLGIARLPEFIVADALARGLLVTLLPDWRLPMNALHLVTPPSPLRPARVEALIAFLAERLRQT